MKTPSPSLPPRRILPTTSRSSPGLRRAASQSGSVLLEVVLALALFVGAATIISSGINASVHSVERIRLQNHALNLAITVLSEMQMQIRAVAPAGPEPFPAPFQDWTCQIEVAPSDEAGYGLDAPRAAEVIIRNTQENVVQRLTRLFPATEVSSETNSPSGPPFPGQTP